jgi:hypothetical protein
VWTHIVAGYDASAGTFRYIDGAAPAHRPGWRELISGEARRWSGRLTVGRGFTGGAFGSYLDGAVADVRLFDRRLYVGEVSRMASAGVGTWALDGGGGDDSSYGRDATATPSVSWVDDRSGTPGSAARLNGIDGWLTTTGPAIRTDQSFTVSAWVKLDGTTGNRAVASQDGARASGFVLGYWQSCTCWSFGMPHQDRDDPTMLVAAGGTVRVGVWTHLVGVFDAAAGTTALYVDGLLTGQGLGPAAAWDADGAFAIGRGRWNGAITDFWPGDLDSVRVHAGVTPASRIPDLYGS